MENKSPRNLKVQENEMYVLVSKDIMDEKCTELSKIARNHGKYNRQAGKSKFVVFSCFLQVICVLKLLIRYVRSFQSISTHTAILKKNKTWML